MLAAFLSKISMCPLWSNTFSHMLSFCIQCKILYLPNTIHQFSILYSWWFFVCFEVLSGRAVVSPSLAHSKLLFTCSLMSQKWAQNHYQCRLLICHITCIEQENT